MTAAPACLLVAVAFVALFALLGLLRLSLLAFRALRIRPMFARCSFWIGAFWDRKARALYVFPVPTLGVKIDRRDA